MAYIETIATHDVQDLSEADIRDIGLLLSQLSSTAQSVDRDTLSRTLEHSLLVLLRLVDGSHTEVVAMGLLSPLHGLSALRMHIDDVCVGARHRGKGYGKLVVETLLMHAQKTKARSADLTSNPSRVSANALYQSLGFEMRETNVYRFELPPEPPT